MRSVFAQLAEAGADERIVEAFLFCLLELEHLLARFVMIDIAADGVNGIRWINDDAAAAQYLHDLFNLMIRNAFGMNLEEQRLGGYFFSLITLATISAASFNSIAE